MANPPPLAYSLPAFSRGGYAQYRAWLDDLRSLGFQWVTFTPTYLVYDETPMRIDPDQGPSLDELREAVAYAVSNGFNVKLEPHLDWETTLTGGPYEWRRRMYFTPDSYYGAQILLPLAELIYTFHIVGRQFAMTLGSELDVSAVEFSEAWRVVLADMRRIAGPQCRFGHKLNHDSLELSSSDIRNALNAERAKFGLSDVSRIEYRRKVRRLGAYLAELDFTAFSFYPDMRIGKTDEWWRAPATADQVKTIADAFDAHMNALSRKLFDLAGGSGQIAIGEFGIGCTDPARPYDFVKESFLDPGGSMNAGAAELRRKFYLGFFEALGESRWVTKVPPPTFWTVGQYDFLGALRQPGYEAFQDDTLRRAVLEYNDRSIPA